MFCSWACHLASSSSDSSPITWRRSSLPGRPEGGARGQQRSRERAPLLRLRFSAPYLLRSCLHWRFFPTTVSRHQKPNVPSAPCFLFFIWWVPPENCLPVSQVGEHVLASSERLGKGAASAEMPPGRRSEGGAATGVYLESPSQGATSLPPELHPLEWSELRPTISPSYKWGNWGSLRLHGLPGAPGDKCSQQASDATSMLLTPGSSSGRNLFSGWKSKAGKGFSLWPRVWA